MAPSKSHKIKDPIPVWKYFIKKDTATVTCKICHKDMKFISTSNMRSHLRCKNHSILRSETDDTSGVLNENDFSFTPSVAVAEARESVNNKAEEVIHYEKLVVPVSMRSIYWKYFGFPANESGQILTRERVVCILCKKIAAYKRNTTNLRMHLQCRHEKELTHLEGSMLNKEETVHWKKKSKKMKKDYLPQLSTEQESGTLSSTLEICHSVEEQHSDEVKSLTDALLEFVIFDMQLPDIVECEGFQRLLAFLRSPCEIPGRSKLVEELIPQVYVTIKETVQNRLQAASVDMALCVEDWQASTGQSYITFSVSFQKDINENVMNYVLSTVHYRPSSDKTFWESVVDKLQADWSLNIRVVVFASNCQELLQVFAHKGLIVLPCLVHMLQEVCTGVCFAQEDMQNVLSKIRAMIYLIYSNDDTLSSLRVQDHLLSLQETPLVADNPRLWLSTYSMLEGMAARREILHTILDNVEATDTDLTDQEWCLVDDVIAVLEPFKVTLMTLSEETTPLVSLVRPLLQQLLNCHLVTKDEESINIQIFKSSLKTLILQKFTGLELDQFLNIATTLDPRFKNLPSTAEYTKGCLDGPIRESLATLIKNSTNVKPVIEVDGSGKKKLKLGMMLGQISQASSHGEEVSNEERTNMELAQYKSEMAAPLDQCSLAWWNNISSRCPHLARLAARTFVPATAIPARRIALDVQLVYEAKRANLASDIIDKLIFLNANYTLGPEGT